MNKRKIEIPLYGLDGKLVKTVVMLKVPPDIFLADSALSPFERRRFQVFKRYDGSFYGEEQI